jgi:pimeloyl-ACP methyl ester carboxylesterase
MRPLLFAISGFMPGEGALDWLADAVPEAEVIARDLPGFNSPVLPGVDPGPATTAAAFRAQLPAGRRTIVLGCSTGCLPALQMGAAELVLVEPFLRPMEVWPLREFLARLVADHPGNGLLRRMVFGYFGSFGEGRDFTQLRELAPPRTAVVVGETPLEPRRPLPKFPSMTGEAERAAWLARGASLHVAPAVGHAIPEEARGFLAGVVRQVLAAAA